MGENDQHLAAALRLRSPSALGDLMDHYGSVVYGLVGRILAGTCQPEDVEECVSDVFLKAWRRIEEYDATKGSLRTWLLILAKYAALDARRKLMKKQETASLEEHVVSGDSVENQVLSKETAAEIINMVNELPEPDRTIVYRRYFYYESIEQIAKGLELTAKAIENRLYRLRKMLKTKLGGGREEIAHVPE
ncbi:sigma-70 family RNA polymerase sigma factor [Paenibacillus whitsoniae]|uniref:Sigma-70 family RNA polymerase sigma factor n=1 Tax=Paenibacillus whitsoniae TaxID=2496558 RepID=A0A3S0A072_9BACL|nr:sigma-70 family RNA polymerase sigma factor [Paenibacillus whitsoniae]RTE03523.1 sigma-70 family RNA polymerase sigma factor [Paenibacillus whitsoniae]